MTVVRDREAERLQVARRALPTGSADVFALASMLRALDGSGTAATEQVAAAVSP